MSRGFIYGGGDAAEDHRAGLQQKSLPLPTANMASEVHRQPLVLSAGASGCKDRKR